MSLSCSTATYFILFFFFIGCSDESNWVIPGYLLASASPAHSHDVELSTLKSILGVGVTTFVCLQQE